MLGAIGRSRGTDENIPAWLGALLSFAGFLTVGVYFAGFWAFEGQTPGMRFIGIQLEHDGVPEIGVRRAFRRLWGSALAILPFGLGLVPILFRDSRRGFQDRVSGTDVVKRENRILAPWSQNVVPGAPG